MSAAAAGPRIRRGRAWALAAAVGLASLSWLRPAHASPDYPGALSQHLGISWVPDCTVCHTNDSGGKGTVTRPFGLSMMAHGLVSASEPALFAALDAMSADGTDSVCDGTPDIADLKAGRDPNVRDSDGGSAADCVQTLLTPRYGCGAHVAGPGPESEGSLVGTCGLLLGLAALTLARRPRAAARSFTPRSQRPGR